MKSASGHLRTLLSVNAILCLLLTVELLTTISSRAGEKGDMQRRVQHQITGLFSEDRVADLKEAVATIPHIKLVSIDFKNAVATFEYVPAKIHGSAKPEQIIQSLDQLLKSKSNYTFGIKPLRAKPLEKLRLIEIDVTGLDCKACCLAAYEAIYHLEGVERATASFREGRVTALIDPEKTDRAKLEDALKKRGVTLKAP